MPKGSHMMRHPLETDTSQLQAPLASTSQSFHTSGFYDDKVINRMAKSAGGNWAMGKVEWGSSRNLVSLMDYYNGFWKPWKVFRQLEKGGDQKVKRR